MGKAPEEARAKASLRVAAKAMLPGKAELGFENFAGDPFVKDFFEWASARLAISPTMFVSWACPPEVILVESGPARAIVRSERFDPLLVEYLQLFGAGKIYAASDALRKDVMDMTILRWMCEFFLGYKLPICALATLIESNKLTHARLDLRPFRDESLASMPAVAKAAVQCFCLAHEMSHLVQDNIKGNDLSSVVDGFELRKHFCRDLEEALIPESSWPAVLDRLKAIDIDHLIREIDADRHALKLVVAFILKTFDVSVHDVIYATLLAYSAQSFLYAAKHSCFLFRSIKGAKDFADRDWLNSIQISVRTRCILRRAGMLMASVIESTPSPSVDCMESCRRSVDAMIIGDQRLLTELAFAFQGKTVWLIERVWRGGGQGYQDRFDGLLETVAGSAELRLDLFYILVAMGCPGGTDPIKYVQQLSSNV